jgi:predicted hydrocarbon binding protein
MTILLVINLILSIVILVKLYNKVHIREIIREIPKEIIKEIIRDKPSNYKSYIEIVKDVDGNWETLTRLEGGMNLPENHLAIGAALKDPSLGVRWNDGHIERGSL